MCFLRHGAWLLVTGRQGCSAACVASASPSSAAGGNADTHCCCPFTFPGCSFLAEALTQRMPSWSSSLSSWDRGRGRSWTFSSCSCLLSHEHTTWLTLISPVTCSTFSQKCKAALAKNTHIKCSRSRGHSSKMLINFENLTQPGHETEGRTFVVGTDFQKLTTVLGLAGVCADVARQLRGRCGKQEALLMGP